MQRLLKVFLGLIFVVFLCAIGAMERVREMRTMQGNVEAYARMQQLDPLFAFPGSSTESLEKAISAFTVSATVAVPPYPEGQAVRDAMYPFHFLEHIPNAEAARRALMVDPTTEHALAYHNALHTLVSSYIADIENARSVLVQGTSSPEYDFLSGKTTASYVEKRLAQTEIDAHRLLVKEDQRFACAQGDGMQCESLVEARATFGTTIISKSAEQKNSPPTQHALRNKDILQGIYPTLASSPLIELTSSECYTYAPIYYAVAPATSRLSGIPSVDVVLLSDIYLDDVTRTNHPFYQALAHAGEKFTYQPFNIYLCPDAGEDMGEVLAISNLAMVLAAHPFTFSGSASPVAEQFQQAQKQILEEQVLTQKAHDTFIAASTELVRTYGIDGLASRLGSNTEVVRLTELVTEARARSSNLSLVLGYFDDLQVGSFIPYHYRKSSSQAFLIARGGFSQLFALNNRTIQPTFRSLVITRATASDSKKDLLNGTIRSYTDDVSKELSVPALQETLLRDIQTRQHVFGTLISSLLNARTAYTETHIQASH